ncbi:MAG: hypothetical protein WB441_11980 [Nocardioidaceae bacterium]
MSWWNLLDEHPLEPRDVDRARLVAETVLGSADLLVQAIRGPDDPFVGSLRVIDLQVHRGDRAERARRVRDALREAGYDAQIKPAARSSWPDVEVNGLRAAEWRRRAADTA